MSADERCFHCGDPASAHSGPKCSLCPCGSSAPSALTPGQQFEVDTYNERRRQVDKGYTPEHDDEHGMDHLLTWALHYAKHGEAVKSAALIVAAREMLMRDRIGPTAPQPRDGRSGV